MSQATAIGATIGVEELERDPYPAYARLRADEPVSWVESVGLWLVTRWDDVSQVIKMPDVFTAETEPSTLNQAIGHYPSEVIAPIAHELIDGFVDRGEVELAGDFAEPLSVNVLKRATGL